MRLRRVLAPEPASASAARRFALDALHQWREEAAADVVTLLVSELVTNALLHAGTPIELGLQRRGGRLRVEVADQSPVSPGTRHYEPDAATGRGLSLVQLLSAEWGIEHQPPGKVVWFEVDAIHRVVSESDEMSWVLPPRRHDDVIEVRLLNTPVQLFTAMQQQTEALLREYALIVMQSDEHGRRAPRLDVDLSAALEQLRAATNEGRPTVDLRLATLGRASRTVPELLIAVDEAERLAAHGRLLTAAALPEIAACRLWFLGQVADQLGGAAPQPWTPAVADSSERAAPAVDAHLVLDSLLEAVIVADDDNRIAHANPAAEALLGWDSGGLVGQRLTAIIPERLHEAHVAGYTRYLVTRTPRLIGQPLRVPARRRDGSEVDIELGINAFATGLGRQAFVAALRRAPAPAPRPTPNVSPEHLIDAVLTSLNTRGEADVRAAMLAELGTALGWEVGAWWAVEGDSLRCTALWERAAGQRAAFVAATQNRGFEAGVGVPGRVWSGGDAVWVTDVVADANFPRAAVAIQEGLRTACAFPVVSPSGEVVAVCELYAGNMMVEDPDLLDTLRRVGRLAGWVTDR